MTKADEKDIAWEFIKEGWVYDQQSQAWRDPGGKGSYQFEPDTGAMWSPGTGLVVRFPKALDNRAVPFCEACGRFLEWISAAKDPPGYYVCPTCGYDQSECDCEYEGES